MAKLTGPEIVKQHGLGRIVIDPLNKENVGPNSVDLTLAPRLLVYQANFSGGLPLDMRQKNETHNLDIPETGLVLRPDKFYLGVTNERAGSDFFVPCIEGRSSIGRLGIAVHETAGFGDHGFNGYWTLEISCKIPVRIYAGVRICQVYFETIEGERDPYLGKYTQIKCEPVASRTYKDFENE